MSENAARKPAPLPYTMVFACSGAADVGCISDRAARQLAREHGTSMSCTAAIAAEIPEILDKARAAERRLVLDGCDKDCARKIIAGHDLNPFVHVQLESLGMKKGETPPTDEAVNRAVAFGRAALEMEAGQ